MLIRHTNKHQIVSVKCQTNNCYDDCFISGFIQSFIDLIEAVELLQNNVPLVIWGN